MSTVKRLLLALLLLLPLAALAQPIPLTGSAGSFAPGTNLSSGTVATTFGNTANSLTTHFSDVMHLADYGVKCDGSTDDGIGANAAITAAATHYAASGKPAAHMIWPMTGNICVINTTINMTNYTGDTHLVFDAYGVTLSGQTTGMPVVDFTGTQYATWHGGHIVGVSGATEASVGIRQGRTCAAPTCSAPYNDIEDVEINGPFLWAGIYNNQSEQTLYKNVLTNTSDTNGNAIAGYVADGYSLFWSSIATVASGATSPGTGSFVGDTYIGSAFSCSGGTVGNPCSAIWLGNTYGHSFLGTNYATTSGSVGGPPVFLYTASGGVNFALNLGDMHKELHGSGGTFPVIEFGGTLASQTYTGLVTNDESCCAGASNYFGVATGVTTVTMYGSSISIANPNTFTNMFDTPADYNFEGTVKLGNSGTVWNLSCVANPGVGGALGEVAELGANITVCPTTIFFANGANALFSIGGSATSPTVTGDKIDINVSANTNIGETIRNPNTGATGASVLRLADVTSNFETALTLQGSGNSNGNGANSTTLAGIGGVWIAGGGTTGINGTNGVEVDASGTTTVFGAQKYTGVVKTTPANGGNVTYAAEQKTALIVPAGTLAVLTITLPACAAGNDGDERNYVSTQIITALTMGASSGSVVDGATSLAIGAGHMYHCYGADTAWYQFY